MAPETPPPAPDKFVRLPAEQHAALTELAELHERSLAGELRIAVRNWLALHSGQEERAA